MRRAKITVIGAGNVGAATASALLARRLGDVVLMDVREGLAAGRALDLGQAASLEGVDCSVSGARHYEQTAGSDLVVIAAGVPRSPGMSRDDLLRTNHEIVGRVTRDAVRYSPASILLVVSNPLDAMVQTAFRASGFPRRRVLGMAGVLDAARFASFIAAELDVSVENVRASVVGGHGDTMVPLPRYSTVAGVPITRLLGEDAVGRLVERTRQAGREIVELQGTSAWLAPGSGVAEMAEAILRDRKKILPCAVYLEGEYGISGVFLGVPAKLGAGGLIELAVLDLTLGERAALQRSAAEVRALLDIVGI
jgi:malate dehydrogenase